MRCKLVVGNWKMHGSKAETEALLGALKALTASASTATSTTAILAVCPPFVYLPQVAQQLAGSPIAWGAQNLSEFDMGAYTGEISGAMLAEWGCRYVIVGHSERRALFAEADEQVANKLVAAQQAGLIPILCVGESLAQRQAGATLAIIEQQLRAVMTVAGVAALARSVIAYEPIWAIGTGETATPEQAQQVHAFIRELIAAESEDIAAGLQLLYGGSVKADNAAELFAQPDIDGALVGGASLIAEDFAAIFNAAN